MEIVDMCNSGPKFSFLLFKYFSFIVIILFVSYYYQGRRQAGNYYALGLSSSDMLYKMSDKFNDDY